MAACDPADPEYPSEFIGYFPVEYDEAKYKCLVDTVGVSYHDKYIDWCRRYGKRCVTFVFVTRVYELRYTCTLNNLGWNLAKVPLAQFYHGFHEVGGYMVFHSLQIHGWSHIEFHYQYLTASVISNSGAEFDFKGVISSLLVYFDKADPHAYPCQHATVSEWFDRKAPSTVNPKLDPTFHPIDGERLVSVYKLARAPGSGEIMRHYRCRFNISDVCTSKMLCFGTGKLYLAIEEKRDTKSIRAFLNDPTSRILEDKYLPLCVKRVEGDFFVGTSFDNIDVNGDCVDLFSFYDHCFSAACARRSGRHAGAGQE